ncbi:MAG: hypothetical protein K2I66_02000 [Bacteroidales bacterium]|nr:hypothetical protein [Bacteroidales bacterium]
MKRIFRIGLFLLLAMTIACHSNGRRAGEAYVPQSGDLLFVLADASAFSGAIADATAQHDSLKFSHVAIVGVQNGQPYVVEASSRCGVARTAWDTFFSLAPKIDGKPGVVAMRVVADGFHAEQALARAETHIGEAYDWSFLPNNGKMYCSELVYESYLLEDGRALFSARPMNFRNAEGHLPEFWRTLFEELGEAVPEGIPGTNPNDLSKETSLVEIWRGF